MIKLVSASIQQSYSQYADIPTFKERLDWVRNMTATNDEFLASGLWRVYQAGKSPECRAYMSKFNARAGFTSAYNSRFMVPIANELRFKEWNQLTVRQLSAVRSMFKRVYNKQLTRLLDFDNGLESE